MAATSRFWTSAVLMDLYKQCEFCLHFYAMEHVVPGARCHAYTAKRRDHMDATVRCTASFRFSRAISILRPSYMLLVDKLCIHAVRRALERPFFVVTSAAPVVPQGPARRAESCAL